jgi:diguanylate cyclase (GGDEF)-like protein/PAS domain S-box-containing protein
MFPRAVAATYLDLQRATIAAGDDFETVMQLVADHALMLMPSATGAAIELVDGDDFVYRACSGQARKHIGFRVPVRGSFTGLCIAAGQPLLCADSEIDDRVNRALCRATGLRSMVVVPLTVDGDTKGVLKVMSAKPSAFGDDDLLVVELLAGPVAIGLAAQLRHDQRERHARLDRRFRATFDHAAVGIAHVAADGRFLAVNDKFCEIVGHGREALLTGAYQQITHDDDVAEDNANVTALLGGEIDSYTMEKRYIAATGATHWARLTVSLVREDSGAPDYFVSVIEDIGAQKLAEAQVLTDTLTQLPNRRWLAQQLPLALQACRNACTGLGFSFLDLDGFKGINDRFGHDVGDRCLREIAKALRSQLGEGSTVARLSGDEFVVLSENVDEARLRAEGERLQHAVGAIGHENGWPINASIGSVYVEVGACVTASVVMKLADGMMYSAKKAGGSRHMLMVVD